MAPKLNVQDPEIARLLELFATISLTGQRAQDTVKNEKYARALEQTITSLHLDQANLDPKHSSFVVVAASSGADLPGEKRDYIVRRILSNDLKSTDQINTACKYIASEDMPLDAHAFDAACGVGVDVSPEQCRAAVIMYMDEHATELEEVCGWPKMSAIMGAVRGDPSMRWANAVDIKTAVEQELTKRFGPRAAAQKKKAATTNAPAKKPKQEEPGTARPDAMFKEGFLANLHPVGGNPQRIPALREQHIKATNGSVMTRFPPEPNGFLHIGHSKAIAVNFGFARFHGGLCYLRFDDTNPEAEEEKYFTSIIDTVRWLGFEPYKVTYSSDYFQRLYTLAIDLIKRGLAFVDHSTPEEIRQGRGGPEKGARQESKWRNRPAEENLAAFEAMRTGKYKPGEAVLRMKQDILGSGNPQMWDLIAYRVLEAPHHRTGKTWCIYPTYDFTHCLVDSFENISHSLCTTEFILARESYEWLCDALEVYKPRQYEYGRLSIEGTVMSKRKMLKLVNGGYVDGWDDPRMYTLIGLRRRGVPPGAILSFVNSLGVTTNNSVIQTNRFDQSVRQFLELDTPRLMMVLKPLKITIENLPDDFLLEITKPLHPKVPTMGSAKVPFTNTVYIDASDFRTEDAKDYFRLAPGKTVGLYQVPAPITCTSFRTDERGEAVELICRYEEDHQGKPPKTYIQWVAEHAPSQSPVHIKQVNLFRNLFTCESPAAEDNFLDHINPNSRDVLHNAMLEPAFFEVARLSVVNAHKEAEERMRAAEALTEQALGKERAVKETQDKDAVQNTKSETVGKEAIRFQAMRVGYFAVDRESSMELFGDKVNGPDVLFLNRIVSLKEDGGKS
ncbi:glutamine--tRNA ligase [Malassezia vespertilionis]|uniref:glutamine--tRNA ligase n=1 Tax=Malassezia vespertilionis TaxID=2020962 RepID=UPI0024B12A79|nr:glutamine--tRNA ligase [Malassezia vespertilionis]WFD07275.1 glutamine--tRNA ligase [Malassezia vespertilionis]